MANKYEDRPYEIGKGKPPVHTRFGNGQPTDRGGRPKRTKNADTIFEEALNRRVTVMENGKERQVSKYTASVIQIVNRAAKGDLKAFAVMMQIKRDLDTRRGDVEAVQPLVEADRQVLAGLVQRLLEDGGSDG